MSEPRSDSIQFCHKQTMCGVVLMVRDTQPANDYGDIEWRDWRKATYVEYEIYMQRKTA
jgi:hypothetical protein